MAKLIVGSFLAVLFVGSALAVQPRVVPANMITFFMPGCPY